MHTNEDLVTPARPSTHGTSDRPSLDPEDWQAFAQQASEVARAASQWQASLRERKPWQPVPPDVRARLEEPLPRTGVGLEATLDAFDRDVLPYPYGNVHPRFWGWVNGSGLPSAFLADLWASAMNCNLGAFDHAAVYVEETVLAWSREMLGFPSEGDGILTSGGSHANLYGLAVARTMKAPFDVRTDGLAGGPRLCVYGSREIHNSIDKALELLGLGSSSLRRIEVDADHRIRIDALRQRIAADRAAGAHPLCVVGNAGTVNTGATDDLEGLADLCAAENLWFHVDGAFGAMAWLCPEERPALRGMQRADSLAFDLHKWLYLPNDVGCVLVRHADGLRDTFKQNAPYLASMSRGMARDVNVPFMDRGLELTRRFRALKVWFVLKEHGLGRFEEAIRRNLNQARTLVDRIEEEPELELCAPAPLNVVCFRYVGTSNADEDSGNGSTEASNALNRELLGRLQENGAVPSHTTLAGRFCLRAAITNHRTNTDDLDFLVDETLRLGRELEKEHMSYGKER